MTKAADIMAAATPGPWAAHDSYGHGGTAPLVHIHSDTGFMLADVGVGDVGKVREDARAIVTAVNLFPLYEAVREAARELLYIGAVRPFRDAAEDRLGAALDALQAAEDAL